MDNTEQKIKDFKNNMDKNINSRLLLSKKANDELWNTQLMRSLTVWYYLPFWQKVGRGKYWDFPDWPPSAGGSVWGPPQRSL